MPAASTKCNLLRRNGEELYGISEIGKPLNETLLPLLVAAMEVAGAAILILADGRADRPNQEMRRLLRTRKQVSREKARHILRIQKTLEDNMAPSDKPLSSRMRESFFTQTGTPARCVTVTFTILPSITSRGHAGHRDHTTGEIRLTSRSPDASPAGGRQ